MKERERREEGKGREGRVGDDEGGTWWSCWVGRIVEWMGWELEIVMMI